MALVDGVEQNPADGAGAGDTGDQGQSNDGNRADTNRGTGQGNSQAQDGDQKKGADGKVYTFKEDRGGWVPPHRLSEESGKRTKAEQRAAQLEAELESRDKKIRALAGVDPVDKEQQTIEETRAALLKIYPNLKVLDRLGEEQLENLLAAATSAQDATSAQWNRHRDLMMGDLEENIADALNVEKLSEAQSRRLRTAFREEAREQALARAKAEKIGDQTYDYDNDFIARYERGDKKLLSEFAKSFLEEWVTPARRTAAASTVSRFGRPVPRGERTRQPITQGPPKIDYNNDNAFQKALLQARQDGDRE